MENWQFVWNFSPIAFSVFGLGVRWYGLSYIAGFFLNYFFIPKIAQKINLKISKNDAENLIFGLFFCGILGGRLGYFLFYFPEIFWTDPLEIFRIWHGGMSIHGGFLGAIFFGIFFARKKNFPTLKIFDAAAIPFSFSLFFGRIANFLNGELFGIPTNQKWGIVFPHVDEFLRHPSQIYEAGKNLILGGILILIFKKCDQKTGILSAAFLFFYGLFRFLIEFFREPEGGFWIFSTGQILCVIMIFSAIFLFSKLRRNNRS